MDKKKKNIIMIVAVSIIVITFFSISYAALTFRSTSFNQQLVVGDIWMKYDESNGFSIEDAVPGSDYSNYFEFTISGKNTYTKKDIYYDFVLNKGDLPTNKTESNRIPDEYLKFKLVSVDDSNQETEIFTDKTYASLNNQRIHVETIEKNTTSEVNRKYRLYMTIDNSLEIGNKDTAVFTMDEWEQAFASVKVNVTGDFSEKELLDNFADMFKNILTTRPNSYNVEDGIYYISGAKDDNNPSTTDDIDFNYVWYSGKLWRITSIYPDGTMKMITDDVITTIAYGDVDGDFYTNETKTSWVYQWLNEDFLDTLYNYENIIKTDSIWNITSGDWEISTKLPETTMVPAKVGLLNSYEYYKSYEKLASYENGYLNKDYYWWLLNHFDTTIVPYVWYVGPGGHSHGLDTSINNFGIRPVIIVQSTIQLENGSGTKIDPYKIKGDKEEIKSNITLLNTRSSGEYVNFDGELYRIVGIENGTTKINKTDYIRDDNNTVITKYIANSDIFGKDNYPFPEYWDYYLNDTWYNNISATYKNMLEKGTYYLGSVSSEMSYKSAICQVANDAISTNNCSKTSETYSGYVGLPRYGEMFASQLGNGSLSSNDMWLITPYWMISADGSASDMSGGVVRPSINLKSEIVIKSGSGTEHDPFEIGFPN